MTTKLKAIIGPPPCRARSSVAYATPLVARSPALLVTAPADISRTASRDQYQPANRSRCMLSTGKDLPPGRLRRPYGPGATRGLPIRDVAVTIVWCNSCSRDCEETDYKACDSWTEGSQRPLFPCVGTTGLTPTAFLHHVAGAASG